MTRKRFKKLMMAYPGIDREFSNILTRVAARTDGSYAAAYEVVAKRWGDMRGRKP